MLSRNGKKPLVASGQQASSHSRRSRRIGTPAPASASAVQPEELGAMIPNEVAAWGRMAQLAGVEKQ